MEQPANRRLEPRVTRTTLSPGVDPNKDRWFLDLICAIAVGALALALFVATLQPDVGGPEDTPKFQFLGYVLGTGHPPGYPLYVLLSHLFVQLPIGTIAYRANLFSAVMAAIACALTYVIARQLDATRIAALAGAMALATGLTFWTNAVFAEVYSLAAVMVALTVVCLLAWGARGGPEWLLAAIGAASLGVGNHLTIVGVIPAAIIYVLVRDRHVLTPRVIAIAAVIVCLGLAQYGFILLRTHQGAPFLESRASSLSELVDVMLAKRFAKQRFAFTPSTLLTRQIPAVASAIRDELGLVGVSLLVIGLAAAVLRRRHADWLVIGVLLGLLAMVVNLSGDIGGFITSALPLLWALAALGITTIAALLQRVPRVGMRVAATATAITLLLPAARAKANYSAADRNKDSTDVRFMRDIFRQLPARAGFVTENYLVVSLLEYFLLTEEAGPNRGIVGLDYSADAVRRAAHDGRRVFALGEAATFMLTQGLRFERARAVTSQDGVVYELMGEAPCVEVSREWTDISPVLTTGGWVTTMSAFGDMPIDIDMRSSEPLRSSVRELLGAGTSEFTIHDLTPPSRQTSRGASDPLPVMILTRTGSRRPVFHVALDTFTATGRARLPVGRARESSLFCALVQSGLLSAGQSTATIDPTLESEAYFGAGWRLPERVGDGRIRRGEDGAALLLPLAAGYRYRVQLELETHWKPDLDVHFNGENVGRCQPRPGTPCDIALPVASVRDGVNVLSLHAADAPPQRTNTVILSFSRARIERLDAYNGPGR
jgi:hypothetical protein